MPRNPVLHLFRVLTGSCQSELRQQVQFLKAENEILQSKIPGPIRVTTAERARLIRLGNPLGPAIRSLISIVRPETFLKWVREAKRKPKRKASARRSGRPRTPEEIRTLVLRIAREAGFRYTRILAELRKLGIGGVSRSTVVNILKEKRLPTAPPRGECTWAEFLKRQAKTLWACDFLTTRVLMPKGMRYAISLVFVHPGTRCAHVSRATTNPDAAWMHEAVRWFAELVPEGMARPGLLLRDRDGKFAAGDEGFDAALASAGISEVRLPHRAPNLNAHVEPLIPSIEVEYFDHFFVLGTRHLDHLLAEYSDYYNRQRPHSALAFATPSDRRPPVRAGPVRPHQLRCQGRLGGVLRHYYRRAG